MDTFETQLPATTAAPALARSWLRSTLQTWQLDGLGKVMDLLVSEVIANVVAHVDQPMSLRVSREHDRVRVEVDDASPTTPKLRHSEATDVHGRGVFLVDALSDRWGTIGHPGDGKTVWFELDPAVASRLEEHRT